MAEAQRDEFGRYLNYESPEITDKTPVKDKVVEYADMILADKTDAEKKDILNNAMDGLHLIVDYVMTDLPTGVDRVDGKVIRPIIKQVVKEKLDEIPDPVVEEEVV